MSTITRLLATPEPCPSIRRMSRAELTCTITAASVRLRDLHLRIDEEGRTRESVEHLGVLMRIRDMARRELARRHRGPAHRIQAGRV